MKMTIDHHVSQPIYVHDPDSDQIEVCVDSAPRIWREESMLVAIRLPLTLQHTTSLGRGALWVLRAQLCVACR
jgi:catechol-2,3-dioxygenase